MAKPHDFTARISWTGNRGEGTRTYRSYDRTWNIETEGKEVVACSNDPMLGGDRSKHNPEDLLIASLASCHMLWYLHFKSFAGEAIHYTDRNHCMNGLNHWHEPLAKTNGLNHWHDIELMLVGSSA